MLELNRIGYSFPPNPKVLFLTALNSIKLSLLTSMQDLGIECTEITKDNVEDVLHSSYKVFFISPEVLNFDLVTTQLLKVRADFFLKTVDECHLVASWGISKKSKKAFRPIMSLSTGELSTLGGSTLMMTATATSKTMRILKDQFPEIKSWTNILTSPARDNVTLLVPPPKILSTNIELMLDPFMKLGNNQFTRVLKKIKFHLLVNARKSNCIHSFFYKNEVYKKG